MSTFEVPNLDSSTEQDWRAFASRLADRLASGGDLTIAPSYEPGVQGRREMRFHPTHRGAILCSASGLSTPKPPWLPSDVAGIHVFEKPTSWVDHMSALVVAEFRWTWNLPHPSFLRGVEELQTHPQSRTAIPVDASKLSLPSGKDGLRAVVEDTLRTLLPDRVDTSTDGSLIVSLGSLAAHVSIPDLTGICVYVPIVEKIGGRTRAAEIVADLNKHHLHLKFLLEDDRVKVESSIDAHPFVPAHLVRAIDRLTAFTSGLDEAFANNLGGVMAGPRQTSVVEADFPQDDEVPPQLMTLLQLDAASELPLDPDDILSICGRDRATIARYESFCKEQAESWRECAGEARISGEAEVESECEAEAVPWDRAVQVLRLALRTVGFCDNT